MPWRDLPSGLLGSSPAYAGADPNLIWADATGLRDFRRAEDPLPEHLPVLVEMNSNADVAALDAELTRLDAGWIPSLYPRAGNRYCSAWLTPAFLRAYFAEEAGASIGRLELQLSMLPERPRAGMSPVPPRPGVQTSGETRPLAAADLLGVIDSCCNFAHRDLRDGPGTGTRVLNFWHQGGCKPTATSAAQGQAPADLGYGREFSRERLNALMAQRRSPSGLNEDGCYEALNYVELRQRFGHGPAVLGLMVAARSLKDRVSMAPGSLPGWQPAEDPASRADLVFVQLPADAVQDSSSAGLPRLLLDGLRYILSCASPQTRRVVINVSDGSSRGSHDGGSIIEQAMQALITEWNDSVPGRELHLVLAAGNSYDEERHACVDGLQAGQHQDLVLRVPPGSEAPGYLMLRLPESAAGLGIGVAAPGQDLASAPLLRPGEARGLWPTGAPAPVCALILPGLRTGGATMAMLAIAPTAASSGDRTPAPAGDWRIRISCASTLPEPVHLYVCRNQRNAGALLRGRQARFVDPDGRYDPGRAQRAAIEDADPPQSAIRRRGSLNSLACVPNEVVGFWVVGSGYLRTGEPSIYASAGAAAGGTRIGPSLSAPSDVARELPGICSSGIRSGQFVRVKGTSFSSPQVARQLFNTGGLPDPLQGPFDEYRNGAGNLLRW